MTPLRDASTRDATPVVGSDARDDAERFAALSAGLAEASASATS